MKIQSNQILQIAKNAIYSKLGLENEISKYQVVKKTPEFVLKAATFVTLNKNGNLRGCIGSLASHTELYEDLKQNAIKAAFKDPRFKPVTKEELKDITIEVSILTPAIKVEYDSFEHLCKKIIPNKHGVILKTPTNQGTYLPQVWESIPKPEDFLISLCQKAGMKKDCFKNKPEIFFYEVEKIK